MSDPHAAVAAEVMRHYNLVAGATERFHVAPAIVLAVIHDESGGNPDAFRVEPAVSDASFGLMQVLWGTARGLGYFGPVRFLFDTNLNIELGTQYLASQLAKYRDPLLALIAYNAGPGAVRVYKAGWTWGRGVRYAKTVLALQAYYARLLAVRAANG